MATPTIDKSAYRYAFAYQVNIQDLIDEPVVGPRIYKNISDASHICIRVVGPVGSTFGSVSGAETSDGEAQALESSKLDVLVSANVVCVTQVFTEMDLGAMSPTAAQEVISNGDDIAYATNSINGNSSYDDTAYDVEQVIKHITFDGHSVIDVIISYESSSIINNKKAHITMGLTFASGFVDTLGLYLRKPGKCVIKHSVSNLAGDLEGGQGNAIKLDVYDRFDSTNSQIFTAYNWVKSYYPLNFSRDTVTGSGDGQYDGDFLSFLDDHKTTCRTVGGDSDAALPSMFAPQTPGDENSSVRNHMGMRWLKVNCIPASSPTEGGYSYYPGNNFMYISTQTNNFLRAAGLNYSESTVGQLTQSLMWTSSGLEGTLQGPISQSDGFGLKAGFNNTIDISPFFNLAQTDYNTGVNGNELVGEGHVNSPNKKYGATTGWVSSSKQVFSQLASPTGDLQYLSEDWGTPALFNDDLSTSGFLQFSGISEGTIARHNVVSPSDTVYTSIISAAVGADATSAETNRSSILGGTSTPLSNAGISAGPGRNYFAPGSWDNEKWYPVFKGTARTFVIYSSDNEPHGLQIGGNSYRALNLLFHAYEKTWTSFGQHLINQFGTQDGNNYLDYHGGNVNPYNYQNSDGLLVWEALGNMCRYIAVGENSVSTFDGVFNYTSDLNYDYASALNSGQNVQTTKPQIDLPGFFASMYTGALPYMERTPHLSDISEDSDYRVQDLIGRSEVHQNAWTNNIGATALRDYACVYNYANTIEQSASVHFAAQDLAVYIASPLYRNTDKDALGLNTIDQSTQLCYYNSWLGGPPSSGVDSDITSGNNAESIASGLVVNTTGATLFDSPYVDDSDVWPVTGKQPIINYPSGSVAPVAIVDQKIEYRSYPSLLFNEPNLTVQSENVRLVNTIGFGESVSTFTFGSNNCGMGLSTFVTSTSTANDQASVELNFFYLNLCNGTDLQTSAGETQVTSAEASDLATRVAKVLEIFPIIRYTPGKFTHGETGAYEVNLEDGTDIDDIGIFNEGNGYFRLYCRWVSDANDLDPDEVAAPFTNVFGDIPEDQWDKTHNVGTLNQYMGSDVVLLPGTTSINSPKASGITIGTIDGTNDPANLDDIYRVDTTSASGETDLSIYIPFHVWGYTPGAEPPPPPADVLGCTDPEAYNYDATANVDDGSCKYCDEILPQDWTGHTLSNGIGIKGISGTHRIGGQGVTANSFISSVSSGHNPQQQTVDLFSNSDYPHLSGLGGVKHGGVFLMETDSPAVLRTASNIPNPQFGLQLTTFMTAQVQAIITAASLGVGDIFKARIYANSDDVINEVGTGLGEVYTLVQKDLGTSIAPEVSGTGSFTNPTFDFTANFPVYSGGFYVLEVEIDLTKLSATCGDAGKKFYAYVYFGVSFCGCTIAGNTFTETGWPWSSLSAFPAVTHNTAFPQVNACGASGANTPAVNDPIYNGDDPTKNVCFTPDTNLDSCESYWSWCIHDSSTICADVPIEDYVETVVDGITILSPPPQTTFSISVEGYWNALQDIYQITGTEYTLTVTLTQNGTITQTFTQDETDAFEDQPVAGGPIALQNYFTILGAGTITVTIQFDAPYTDPNLSLESPCIFTESFDVSAQGCDELVLGCTDPNAINFNSSATFDDGSCEFPTPCDEFYLNPAVQNLAATGTNATSVCQTITTTVGNEEVTYEIATAQSDGTITITGSIIDENSELDVTQFSIAWIYANGDFDPPVNDYSGALDALASQYQNAITGDGATQGITIGGFAAWSPLLDLNADGTFSVTLGTASPGQGFVPGVYNYYVVPYIYGNDTVPDNCPQEPITVFDAGSSYTVQLTDIECEEPCVELPCGDQISGCTDPSATNYNADATIDDGSCEYETSFCEQYPEHPACNDCEALAEALGIPVEKVCEGTIGDEAGACTDPNACNYDYNASLDNTNNALCDYCSCADPNDPDCFPDEECDPDEDPNCLPAEPPCPDPENPDCTVNPTVTCPTPQDCPPPPNPCIILNNCTPDSDPPPVNDDVFDATVTFETTCEIDVANSSGQAISFAHLQNSALSCMSEEGAKMLFKLKAGVKVDKTELQKLSMIAYIMLGGAERTDLPCIWNCNYESRTRQDKRNTNDCNANWANGNFRIWNSTDSFSQGQTVAYHFYRNGRLTRGLFVAKRDIFPHEPHPRFPQSGWEVCKDRRIRTKDANGIADGTENYMQIFFEFINRYCQSCSVVGQTTAPGGRPQGYVEATNTPTDGLDVPERKNNDFNDFNTFGILDENGNEIDF